MKSFLQSSDWLDFQKALNRRAWNIDNVNVIKYLLPFRKSYLYSPRCKFLSESFLNKIKELAKKENAIFFKVEPENDFNKKNFKKSLSIQPKKTLILDITKKDLLEKMHYKTRYNIRLAEKKGIIIKKAGNIEDFWKLVQKTTQRKNFNPHLKEHYIKLLKIPNMELFTAEYKNKVIAANIVLFFKDTCFYLHGASDYEYRNLMAPYLLQWKQIAKKRNCKKYDFWGIDKKKWPGVTRFKKGFNGKEIEYIGAYDLVFNKFWYLIYKLAKYVRRK